MGDQLNEERKRALRNLKLLNDNIKGIDEFSYEESVEMMRHNHPHMSRVSKNGSETYAVSIVNLKEEYMVNNLMTSLIGYLGQCIEEYGVPKGETPEDTHKMDEDKLITEFIEENLIDGKPCLREYADVSVAGGEQQQVFETKRNKLKRLFMSQMLRDIFVVNPNRHIRSAYEEPSKEEAHEAKKLKAKKTQRALARKTKRMELAKLKSAGKNVEAAEAQLAEEENAEPQVGVRERINNKSKRSKVRAGEISYAEIEKLHQQRADGKIELPREEVERIIRSQKFSNTQEYIRMTELIPPADLFYRFRLYRNANYPAIKEATHMLYRVRPDWEYSINIHESFRGDNIDKQCTKWLDRNESMITVGTHMIEKGAWTILSSTVENRQRITFGSKESRVLQDMIREQEKKERLGDEIKEKRRRDDRKLNEEQAGKHAAGVKKYAKDLGSVKEISKKERVELDAEGPEARGRSNEVANKYGAIQMDEIVLNPKEGNAQINHIFLESEAPNPEQVEVVKSGERKE